MGLRPEYDHSSEYAQKYLDCLKWREPQLEALLRRAGFSAQIAVDAVQNALFEAYKVISVRMVERLGERLVIGAQKGPILRAEIGK